MNSFPFNFCLAAVLLFLLIWGSGDHSCLNAQETNSRKTQGETGSSGASVSEPPLSPNALGSAWELFSSETVRTWAELDRTDKKAAEWRPVIVPAKALLPIEQIHWYRTELKVPELKADQRAFLCFDGVKFAAQIRIGRENAPLENLAGGGEPFEIEISELVRGGGTHELVVRVEGVTAAAKEQPETLRALPGHRHAENFKQTLLYPVGSQGFSGAGIWDPVRLEIRDTIYVQDLFIQTSWREKKIAVDFQVKNLTDRTVSFPVSAEVEETDVRFEPKNVSIPAGETVSFRMERPWESPRVWSPRDPHLYFLKVRMGDFFQHRERFGFREIWCDGDVFVLNGVPFHALGTASHPHTVTVEGDSHTPAVEFFRKVRTANVNHVRLHANLWPRAWVEAADELGMPLTLEGAFFCWVNAYAMNDEVFWRNFDRHIRAIQKKHRNNPSFCFLSMCNEVLHCGGERYCANVEHLLAEAGKSAKIFDATRPISFDGDMDPEGAADVVNPHYPMDYAGIRPGNEDHEWPQDCWWIENGKFMACYPGAFWKWDREKPLYFGEFLHIQHFTDSNPYSLVLGDEAYGSSVAQARAKAKTWRMQIPAYRAAGVTGFCPWTLTEFSPAPSMDSPENARFAAVQDSYEPVMFALEPIPAEYFAGEPVSMKFWLLNDTDAVRDVRLDVSLGTQTQNITRRLPPAGREPVFLTFSAEAGTGDGAKPKGDSDARADGLTQTVKVRLTHTVVPCPGKPEWDPDHLLTGKLLPPGEDRFFLRTGYVEREFPIFIEEHQPLGTRESTEERQTLGFIGDPETAKFLGARWLKDLADPQLAEIQTLLIGKNQLSRLFPVPERRAEPGQAEPLTVGMDGNRTRLHEFLAVPGCRVVVLEQETYPAGLFPVSLSETKLSDPRNTEWTFFPSAVPFHYPQDYAFRPDGQTVRFGGLRGFQYCPILHLGNLSLCQLPVETHFRTSPSMRNQLFRLIQDSVSEPVHAPEVCVLDPSGVLQNAFAALNVPFCEFGTHTHCVKLNCSAESGVSETPTAEDDARFPEKLVFVHADSEPIAPAAGELFILCGADPENLKRWETFLPENVSFQRTTGPCVRASETLHSVGDPGLYAGPSGDLYWLGDRSGLTSRQKTPIQKISDWHLVEYVPDCAKRETFPEISFREFKPSREKGIFRTDEFYCGVQIALETPLNVPSGWYWLEIDGMGSTLAGVGCILEASVSETLQGTVELDTKWSKKGLLIRIPEKVDADASAAILKLDFVNDLWDPVTREDRNLHFRGVQLIPCRKAGTFTTTLAPACAVKVAPNFVVDCVKWFSPEFPTDRAARYVLGVLQSVGVEIPWKPSSACISAEDWDEKTSSLWNLQKSGDMPILFIGTNGMVQKRVVFGKSGRFAFSLNAYGTSCEGVFPHLRLLIDGETVGEFLIDSAEMRNYALRAPIQIEAGEHEIALEFHNDHYIPSPDPAIPHQDRNVRLGSLQIFLED